MGVTVQLAVLSTLKGFMGLHYLGATALAVESAILHNFFWHEKWTWGDRGLARAPGRFARLARFNSTTGMISILGNVLFMRLFVGELGLHYLLGNLASIASCSLLNFVVSDRFVFLPFSPSLPSLSPRAR